MKNHQKTLTDLFEEKGVPEKEIQETGINVKEAIDGMAKYFRDKIKPEDSEGEA